MATLDHAVEVHPEAKWWIKADGCDIVSGLEESVRLEWNGDAVQELYHMYRTRRSAIDMLCTNQSIADRRPAHNQSGLKDFMRHYMMTSLD